MWDLKEPRPVKLIIGMLAADSHCLAAARQLVSGEVGATDLISDIWPFDTTDYYSRQTGEHIVRQFVSIDRLIEPGRLAGIKHQTNRLEQQLAEQRQVHPPRPVNLDPGIIEPSKLILATTKNYAHRIYIGQKMYAEVTLIFDHGCWTPLPYTYGDYRQRCYLEFFETVRKRLLEQLKSQR